MPDNGLFFVLEAGDDVHYVDSLCALGPSSYIWYRLRSRSGVRRIVFCDIRDEELCFCGLDPESTAIVPKSHRHNWIGKQIKRTQEEMLAELISNVDDDRSAVVFTHEAFVRSCRIAQGNTADGLRRMVAAHCGRILIRLPGSVGELARLVSEGAGSCDILQEAYKPLQNAASYDRRPLLDTLTDQLGSRLLRFDLYPGEVQNLLLMHALYDPQAADTPQEVDDQAEYLELCRLYRADLLASDADGSDRAISNRELDRRLREPEFREELRSRSAKLRNRYPNMTTEQAMRQAGLLPPVLPQPVYKDELSNVLRTLTIPDEFLRSDPDRKVYWAAELEQIKRRLTVIWNKPRNTAAVQAAQELCSNAKSAIEGRVWETLDAVLQLLQFFSNQICAPADQTDRLEDIRKHCRDIVQTSNYLYGSRSFGLPTGFDQLIDANIQAGEQANLEKLKFYVHRSIKRFERPDPVFENIASINDEIEAERSRTMLEITESNQLLREQQKVEQERQEEQERLLRNQELTSRYTISGGSEWNPEDRIGECTEEDRQSVIELLKEHHLDWD